MALYAIGDVQGCYDALRRLLDELRFDPTSDTVWFTGDLVNRGPHSALVLRFIAGLGRSAITVLGNHDLHLLAVADGVEPRRSSDNFDDVLTASDRDTLIGWLRTRQLIHHDHQSGFTVVHAGLLPQWTLADAVAYGREVETYVADVKRSRDLFARMYGDEPSLWRDDLTGWDRLRAIVNALTRLRFCSLDGRGDYHHKGALGSQPPHLLPWFQVPDRKTRNASIVFGHWAMLGRWDADGVVAVDTGCGWGRELTGVRLDVSPRTFTAVSCKKQ